MNSWDCFDTLVARRFYHPHTVFDEVGKRLGIKNFKEIRIQAEINSDKTYEGIYKNLPGLDSNIEIQVELEHCFPIVENINRVKDGDIIVSDIYFNSNIVEKILLNAGLKKNIKVFTSTNGKYKGWIWKTLPTIDLHIGDNKRSDVASPRSNSILSELYSGCHFTDIEKYVSNFEFELACWMRYIRLQCPYTDDHRKRIWEDQSTFNLPVLALASLELPDSNVAFVHRDSIFWQPLYEKIRKTKSIRFDSSRHCLNYPSESYKNYIFSNIQNCVIVDLQGTGKSLLNFFKDTLPEVYFIAGNPINNNIKIISNTSNFALEKHNCSDVGTLINWNHLGPIRNPLEHPADIVETQHRSFKIGIDSIEYFKFEKNINLLKFLLDKMINNYTDQTVPWINKHKI
jgi:hypothetical protein